MKKEQLNQTPFKVPNYFFGVFFSRKIFWPNGLEQPGSRRRPAFGRKAAGTNAGEYYSTGRIW
jgi:hypothetical protein